ncbi:hypothetical protein QAD02_021575 [Eretmocerus hayati]|uniref:Uncharacterized protein n=1 Tax=Eretmocerus hayati TaxID=131215 RepID=A0ACC2PTT1_9HYME|nr:hypothetical protein QAD02_021575 [Eretmocerus hayati]
MSAHLEPWLLLISHRTLPPSASSIAIVTAVASIPGVGATEEGGSPEAAGHSGVDVESATPLCGFVDGEVVVNRKAVVDETNSVATASGLVIVVHCWDVSW